MIELKPCPFCGGKARLFVSSGVRVLCSKCYASTMILTDDMGYSSNAVERVTEKWNKRAGGDAPEPKVEEKEQWVHPKMGVHHC